MNVCTRLLLPSLLSLFVIACGPDVAKKEPRSAPATNNATNGSTSLTTGPDTNNSMNNAPNNAANDATNNATNDALDPGTNAGTTATNGEDDSHVQSLCGNGVIDEDEACDGTAETSCEELGFDGGQAQCSDDCLIDVSACVRVTCGDGILDAGEVCDDGPDNGAYGACNATCSGPGPHCGDGVLSGNEACDGTDVAEATCPGLGYDGGTLACSDTCTIDAAACTTCGDGVVDAGEACDDGSANGTYGACNTTCTARGPRCGDGVLDAGKEECDGQAITETCTSYANADLGTLSCTASCTIDASDCIYTPRAGELVINEIMQAPDRSYDNDGEWFEIHNRSGVDLDLVDCTVESGTASGPESFIVRGTPQVPTGAYFTFARSASPGFTPDYDYAGLINLNDSIDYVRIVCDGTEVDRVDYDDGATFPDPVGASMSFDPAGFPDFNGYGNYWCTSTSVFGFGDYGTPGMVNDPC